MNNSIDPPNADLSLFEHFAIVAILCVSLLCHVTIVDVSEQSLAG